MSIRNNIFANFASQLYVTAVGILLVPLYISGMGAEAYGLVGFFAMVQAWFNLADLGLTHTISRETARFQSGMLSPLDYRRLYRPLSVIFFSIALVGGVVLFVLADDLANRWLNADSLPSSEVELALQVMAVGVSVRWMAGLYRGVISGAERWVWLSGFNGAIATLRFVFVLASMAAWGYTPTVFFLHQLGVIVLEVAGLFYMCHRLIPERRLLSESIGWSFRPVRPFLQFAMTIALASVVWVVVTQLDKLLLSGVLPLADYGYFTVAVLVASGILMVSGPVSTTIMPRMVGLHAEGRRQELIRLYQESTQWVCALASSAAFTLIFCAHSLLFSWSNNMELTAHAAPILQLYAAGNALLVIAAFPYYLQYAQGQLRYHLLGNILMIMIFVPGIVYAASNFGGEGTGWAWVGLNGIYLLFWVAYVHHKLVPGFHWKWLCNDVLLVAVPVWLVVFIADSMLFVANSRLEHVSRVIILGLTAIGVAMVASSSLRRKIFKFNS